MIGDVLQPTHLIFILVVALLVLGPKRLPEVGRSLGKGMRDFRAALSGEDETRPGPYEPAPDHDALPVTPATTSLAEEEDEDNELPAAYGGPASAVASVPAGTTEQEGSEDAQQDAREGTESAPAAQPVAPAPDGAPHPG